MFNNFILAGSSLILQSWELRETKLMPLVQIGVCFYRPQSERGIEKIKTTRGQSSGRGQKFFPIVRVGVRKISSQPHCLELMQIKILFLCHYTIDIYKRNSLAKSQIRANNGKTSSNFQKYHTKCFPCSFSFTFLYLFLTIAPILIDFPQLALHRRQKVSVHSVARVYNNCTQHNWPSPNNSVIIKNVVMLAG